MIRAKIGEEASDALIAVGLILAAIAVLTLLGQFIAWMFLDTWPSLSITTAFQFLQSMFSHPISGGMGLLYRLFSIFWGVLELPLSFAVLILGIVIGLIGMSAKLTG